MPANLKRSVILIVEDRQERLAAAPHAITHRK